MDRLIKRNKLEIFDKVFGDMLYYLNDDELFSILTKNRGLLSKLCEKYYEKIYEEQHGLHWLTPPIFGA